jgi:hypothetical protein
MFNINNKRMKICLIGMLISFAVLFIVFIATDGLLGDKEFSEYTRNDWSIAMLPLSIIIVSGISTFAFALIIIIPLVLMYPSLMYYVINKKHSDIDPETKFLVFDHNEFKRACCAEKQNGLWISIKEYDVKTWNWIVLEEGRYIENPDNLTFILERDYKYDRVKFRSI